MKRLAAGLWALTALLAVLVAPDAAPILVNGAQYDAGQETPWEVYALYAGALGAAFLGALYAGRETPRVRRLDAIVVAGVVLMATTIVYATYATTNVATARLLFAVGASLIVAGLCWPRLP